VKTISGSTVTVEFACWTLIASAVSLSCVRRSTCGTRQRVEQLLNELLEAVPGLTQKAMFSGWAWLINSNLLCGARSDGMLARVGREKLGHSMFQVLCQ
jgi:hypothetical protein